MYLFLNNFRMIILKKEEEEKKKKTSYSASGADLWNLRPLTDGRNENV